MIIMPLDTAQTLYHYPLTISMVVARPVDAVGVEEVAWRVEDELNTPVERIRALTADERNSLTDPILDEVGLWNLGISSVLFLTSVTVVTLIAIMNVSERKRDFAVLDALGASFTVKARLVLMELGLISLLGSLIGAIGGAAATVVILSSYTKIPFHIILSDILIVTPPSLLVSTAFGMVTASCMAGLIPAYFASRMNISDLLKGER
jgi:putative ABC transport system permease protein